MSVCKHRCLVQGGGLMGDALTCESCGWSKYPEVLPWWARLRIWLGLTKVRDLRPGEMIFSDGVRQEKERSMNPSEEHAKDQKLKILAKGIAQLFPKDAPNSACACMEDCMYLGCETNWYMLLKNPRRLKRLMRTGLAVSFEHTRLKTER